MLTSQDLKDIKIIVKDVVKDAIKEDVPPIVENIVEKKILDSERRLIAKIDQSKDELRQEIGDYITEFLMPIIDSKADKSELEKVKMHVGIS